MSALVSQATTVGGITTTALDLGLDLDDLWLATFECLALAIGFASTAQAATASHLGFTAFELFTLAIGFATTAQATTIDGYLGFASFRLSGRWNVACAVRDARTTKTTAMDCIAIRSGHSRCSGQVSSERGEEGDENGSAHGGSTLSSVEESLGITELKGVDLGQDRAIRRGIYACRVCSNCVTAWSIVAFSESESAFHS
jgi:hypothetical protein